MKNTYTRPTNIEEIAEQLRIMEAVKDYENMYQLIKDVEWLAKEETSSIDRVAELELDIEEMEREAEGQEEYIEELEKTIESLEEEL
ncbi:hypothetical protein P3U41_06160 [Mammaliicoccus sciuri]|uniref:hypothetical protein n=1 Tax=Mammaliicoccus sciuri TaxID=1296 RepID=UPI002B26185D|nr:hypothetical protein [Mammaliicoccus sciuri]WQL34355.1 hypothetical protein P3U41_06160 [Mammaliicoccus sciuri]WQL61294.1 hypothetical protein P3T96_06160 [Mammaliicoccus sciuri]